MSSSASTPRSGDRVALDTSVAIDVLAAAVDARLLSSVNEHLLPAPVVGELRYGALNSRQAAENLAKDAHFDAIDGLKRWPLESARSEAPPS